MQIADVGDTTQAANSMSEPGAILCPFCRKENSPAAQFCIHCGKDVILNNDSPTDPLRYRITRVIKEGGQGAVYEGVDDQGYPYAIKEMHDHFTDPAERDDSLRRFNAEARLLESLSHPSIPRVYSHFTDAGRHYLTMELVQGEDLDQIATREGAISEAQVLEWADQICEVLAYLHQQGLIYRDVKPSNIMIDQEGRVKVVDFGIAKVFKPNERGTLIGTPGYAPPEQYQGMATTSSDLYALAATLHHLLTGRDPTSQPPFSFPPARDVNVQVSRRTSDAIQKALSMNPEDRFGSVSEFRAMLRPLTSNQAAARHNAPAVAAQSQAAQAAPPASTTTGAAMPPPPSALSPISTPPPPPAPTPPPAAKQQPQQQQHPPPTSRGILRARLSVLVVVVILLGLAVAAYATLTGMRSPGGSPDGDKNRKVNEYFEAEIEIAVPADTNDKAIRATFWRAFEEQAEQHYGQDIGVNQNINPFLGVGNGQNWEIVDHEPGDTLRYRATMRARVESE
jgi:serine/threonine-protein kinase